MAAPPQADVEAVPQTATTAKDVRPGLPLPEYASQQRSPAARLRALQKSHGNYFVQRAIGQYNAAHPLPKAPTKPPPAAAPPLEPASPAPGSAPSTAAPQEKKPAAEAKKAAPPAPAKPVPAAHPPAKPSTAAAKGAPTSGTAAVSAAIAKSPAKLPRAAPTGGGGGGAAGPGPTLDQWKAKSGATAGKQLVTPPAKAAPDGASKLDGEQQKKTGAPKTDFQDEARKKIPPPPKVDTPPAPVDTLAKSVHDTIAAVSDKHLADQTLPPLTKSPGHEKITKPQGQFPVIGAPPVAKQDQAPPKDATATAPADAKDPAAKTDEEKKKQADQAVKDADQAKRPADPAAGTVPAPPAVVRETAPKPHPPVSEAAKSDIGDALAAVLNKSQDGAKEMVNLAEKTAYPRNALSEYAPDIAKNAMEPEKTRLEGELHAIGTAAGFEAADIDLKAFKRKEEEKQQTLEGEGELEAKAKAATDATTKKAQEDQRAIAAAKARNDDEIELKSEAAGTAPDPKLVNERQDRLLNALDDQSSVARVGYRKALEDRNSALDKAATDQIDAYQATSKAEADEIKALFTDNADQGKAEAWPTVAWADKAGKNVRDTVAVLKRDAGKQSKEFQDAVSVAQGKQVLAIHDWADSRLNKARSFWEKIVALFQHWEHAAKSDTEVWEKLRNQGTLDAMAGDIAAIDSIRKVAGTQNEDEMKAAIDGLDQEHQILMLQFFKSGGDSIMAVASALLGRIEQRRVPELTDDFRKQSLEINDWETLNKLAKSKNPNFDAWHLAGEVRASVKGWGTDEDRLFAAIKHHPPIEVKAMKLAYAERFRETDPNSEDYGKGRDMAADIDDDLSGDEADRAKAALESNEADQDIFALHDSLTGFWGADKAAIMDTLRNKSPLERDEILARYKDQFGIDLKAHLDFALDSDAKDQAKALLAGETDKADAIGMQRGLHSHLFGGAEINDIDAVYGQIRKEVEAQAADKNMTTAEVEAEYRRRAAAVESQWNQKYAGGDPNGMKAAFKDRLSGGEQDLAIALAEDKHDVEDAARIRMESESVLYTSDKKVLSVLQKQRERAETEVHRDMLVKYRELSAKEHWSPKEAQEHWDQMNKAADAEIDTRAEKNLKGLEKVYDSKYSKGWGPGALTAVIELEMSGNEQEVARLIRKNKGGKLSIAEEVYWATTGLGTNEDMLRHALKGKTKAELKTAREEYRRAHGVEMDADVFGDVSGRDEHDFGQMLKGKPETPEDELQRMHEDREYEIGSGSGLGAAMAVEESDSLRRSSAKADRMYDTYKQAVKEHGEDSKEAKAALERFRDWTGYTQETITTLRSEVDSLTDHIAMGAALVVGAIVAIATAGTATPAVIAAVSALAGTAASVSVKLAMKGHAYGIEEYGSDVLMGAVDVAAAALTAGVGNALLRTNLLSRLAEDQFLTRTLKYGVAHAGAGLVAGLPTGVVGQIISSDTWASEAPLKTALLGILKTEAMAGAMAFGFGAYEGAKGGHAPAAPHEEAGGTSKTPVHEQKPPAPDLEAQAKQAAKVDPPTDLEARLNAAAKPDDRPQTPGTPEAKAAHNAAVAKNELKMQGAGEHEPPPVKSNGETAPIPDKNKGTTYVEPGSREYHAMLHEGWTDQMLREGLGPFEPAKVPSGPELKPGTFKEGIQTPREAYAAYNEAMARAPGREVGIFRNLDTGEYVVIVGAEGSVRFPYGDIPHEAVLHYHPNPSNVLTFRLPSGADLGEAMIASIRTGRPVTQFVEHPIPGTNKRGRTAITVDAETRKIRVEYVNAEGQRAAPLEFNNEREYAAYWSERKVMPDARTLAEMRAETDRWLAESRGEQISGIDDDPNAVSMAAKKKAAGPAAPAPVKPPRPPEVKVAVLTTDELRTTGKGGVKSINKSIDKLGNVTTTVEGDLLPGLKRKGPARTAANYNSEWGRADLVDDLAPYFEQLGDSPAVARARAQALANNYEAAHLWGPGFGDEAAAGMMWAPIDVNQQMQNRFAEDFIRDLRDAATKVGGNVHVKATAVPFDRVTLWENGLPYQAKFLEHVQYDITLQRPGEPPQTIKVTVKATLPGARATGGLIFDPPEAADRFLALFKK